METADYRLMPQKMKKQQEEGRKDRYIEITQTLLAVKPKELSTEEELNYIEAIADTLDVMDFQIYEWYRSLQDRMAGLIKEMATDGCGGRDSENAGDNENTADKGHARNSESAGDDGSAGHNRNAADDENSGTSGNAADSRTRLRQLAERAVANGFLLKEHVPALFETFEKADSTLGKRLPSFEKLLDASKAADNFSIKLLYTTSRSFTIEIEGAGRYYTDDEYEIYLDGCPVKKAATTVCSIFDLMPAREYEIVAVNTNANTFARLTAETKAESCTVSVRQFGAKGDGVQDDTRFIQAAILSCPKDGRVLIPEGVYRITSLFLRSNVSIELAKGAELRAFTDRADFPVLPSLAWSPDGTKEFCIGTWEGNPLPMFAGIITGIEVENAVIYGEGTINGNASKEDWWKNPKVMNGAFRPRLFYTNRCDHVALQGVTLKNSPAWTIHPFFSSHLGFYNVNIQNPSDSPNTDGLDPESCAHVEIAGVKFSLGDDCIAVKSGKIYLGKTYKTPSEDIRIHHCLMENGHGAVTIGSEMAGGVRDLIVEDCVFSHTDRGLRIKTRRGRGKDAILDNIAFRRIDMDHVMTPFVVNSFYFCDPDGKTEYVQSREPYPVDDRTPCIKRLVFEDIDAKNCHVAAAYLEGLPEQKIEEIIMRRIRVTYADQPKCDVPAMSAGVEACSKRGIFARNIQKLTLQDVTITGQEGPEEEISCVDEIVR